MIGRFVRHLWGGGDREAASAKEGSGAGGSAPLDAQHSDFGWRLHGKFVGVTPDRSFRFVPGEHTSDGVLDPYCSNLTALQACLQCGACTANCALAGESGLFPRRQMNLFQMGEQARLADDPTIWYCYNCDDCSKRCPAGAKPGKLMAAIRQMAVEHFAFPGFLARFVNRPQYWWIVLAVVAMLVLGAIACGGSFSPASDPVRYASMLPHRTVQVFFLFFTGLALICLAVGAARAWRAYEGESWRRARPRLFLRAFRRAMVDVVAQQRLSDCEEHRWHRYAHLAVFYGFVVLAGLAGVAAIMIAVGGDYPFTAGHPLKILGNLAAALLILGGGYFVWERWTATKLDDPSTYFDWVLLGNLLIAGLTGVLCEVFRFQGIAVVAYPTYFLHLVSGFVLLVFLPYSKLAHLCYRTVALTSQEYEALLRAKAPAADFPRLAGRQPSGWSSVSPRDGGNRFDRSATRAASTRRSGPGE
ncbi:MAG TPA: 4Fe-4S dicluster domain-containing protein [Phycisphaerae bacterium]|nr:4Fe-4S dicluster domain-containing protein [Phycisphaerae bacterium]